MFVFFSTYTKWLLFNKLHTYKYTKMATDRKISDYSEKDKNKVLLEETFYVLSKRNAVFRVQLSANGLCLLKESSEIVKKQTIPIKDIIGCQCMRSRRRSRSASSCVCQSLPRTPALKAIDENTSKSFIQKNVFFFNLNP